MSTAVVAIPADKFNLTKFENIEVLPDSWDSALAFMKENGVTIDNAAAVLPEDFPLIEKKDLVNVPLALFNWTISDPNDSNNKGDGQYLVVRGITQGGKRFRFADGSTGIYQQLVKLTAQRIRDGYVTPNAGLIVEKGLTKSEYTYTDDKGKKSAAVTFYLSGE